MKHDRLQSSPLPTELPGPAPFYLVLSEGEPVVVNTVTMIVWAIKDGHIEKVSSVLEINPPEGTCRYVTMKDIAEKVLEVAQFDGYPVSSDLATWLDNHLELSVHHEKQWRELIGAE